MLLFSHQRQGDLKIAKLDELRGLKTAYNCYFSCIVCWQQISYPLASMLCTFTFQFYEIQDMFNITYATS